MYVVCRQDLSLATQAVQSAHAAAEAARQFLSPDAEHPHLVLLGVPSVDDLLALRDHLTASGVRLAVFVEPDLGNVPTALASAPVAGASRRLFRRLPLLFQEVSHV